MRRRWKKLSDILLLWLIPHDTKSLKYSLFRMNGQSQWKLSSKILSLLQMNSAKDAKPEMKSTVGTWLNPSQRHPAHNALIVPEQILPAIATSSLKSPKKIENDSYKQIISYKSYSHYFYSSVGIFNYNITSCVYEHGFISRKYVSWQRVKCYIKLPITPCIKPQNGSLWMSIRLKWITKYCFPYIPVFMEPRLT